MEAMNKQEILARIQAEPYLEIFRQEEDRILVYDQLNGNGVMYFFPEYYGVKDLEERIHIPSAMPRQADPDKRKLAEFLYENLDPNTFLTLDGLWFIGRMEDYEEMVSHYEDPDVMDLARIGAKGFFWYHHRACVVDVPRICRWIREKWGRDCQALLREEILKTAVHELRHQMLEATLVLPREQYPRQWGTEFMVERYAQELCDGAEKKEAIWK